MPFCPFLGEGAPTKIGYRKKVGTLILTSLEDLVGGFQRGQECNRLFGTVSWMAARCPFTNFLVGRVPLLK